MCRLATPTKARLKKQKENQKPCGQQHNFLPKAMFANEKMPMGCATHAEPNAQQSPNGWPKMRSTVRGSEKRCFECRRLSGAHNCPTSATAKSRAPNCLTSENMPTAPHYPPLGTFESSSCFPHVQMLCIFDTLNIVCPPIFQLQKLNHVCVRSAPAF